MNTEIQQIYDFMVVFDPSYINRHGVEFISHDDKSVYVHFKWDDLFEDRRLDFGISYSNEDFETFLSDFKISSIQQLKLLTRERLWEVYYQGKGEVYCIFADDPYFSLNFRRKNNRMVARNEKDKHHVVNEKLITPLQFMQYTYRSNLSQKDEPDFDAFGFEL